MVDIVSPLFKRVRLLFILICSAGRLIHRERFTQVAWKIGVVTTFQAEVI